MYTDVTMETCHFYHSFPRSHAGENTEVVLQKGFAILEAIKSMGLILAPEVVEWKIPLADGTMKCIRHRQVRISFTELSRTELPGHAKKFGPLSLELPLDLLRRAAALPVIYIPQMVGNDRLLSSAGPVMVWMFEMIQYTLDHLEQLSKLADPKQALAFARQTDPTAMHVAENYAFQLQNQNDAGEIEQNFSVEAKTVRGILNYLGYKTAPFALMRGAVHAAQTLFYPTDDERHDELMSYYRQREWRLIPGFAAGGAENARRLSEAEKKKLLEIDEPFWTKRLSDDKGTFRRIDEARVIEKFQDNPIEQLIQAVLVPRAAYDRARAIFNDRVQVVAVGNGDK